MCAHAIFLRATILAVIGLSLSEDDSKPRLPSSRGGEHNCQCGADISIEEEEIEEVEAATREVEAQRTAAAAAAAASHHKSLAQQRAAGTVKDVSLEPLL